MDNRYRVVEIKKLFEVKFSNRRQKFNEFVEVYVVDLKKMYVKVYFS